MSEQNAALAKKATRVETPTDQKELKMLQDRIRRRNKVKRTNFQSQSESSNSGTVKYTEQPRDENILTVQSREGQSSKRKFDDIDHKNVSGLSALNLNAAEGSLLHPVDNESKQLHADSSDVKVSNNQSLKDSLPVIENAGSSGKGFPYAPENWPSPGDVWTWRAGKRCTRAGFWKDRAVQPPDSLRSSTGSKMTFYSRVSVEQYIRNTFPDADVDAFFASFIWKIPATNAAKESLNVQKSLKTIKINGSLKSEPAVQPQDCKANNETCSIKAQTRSSLTPASCNRCCTETNFCPYCCCILCSKTIDCSYEGYSFIKCEEPVDGKFVCGHVAHVECALRAYMAGKVGGIIDLDAQYLCRCCDNKTDLLLHVEKIVKVCESIVNRDDVGKALKLSLCMLRGSEKEKAKKLQSLIVKLKEKLEDGVALDEIWRMKSMIL